MEVLSHVMRGIKYVDKPLIDLLYALPLGLVGSLWLLCCPPHKTLAVPRPCLLWPCETAEWA